MTTSRARKFWLAGGALGLALAVLLTFAILSVAQQGREDRFLETLRADASTTVGELGNEQLLVSREGYCEDIANGVTIDEAVEMALINWNSSVLTRGELIANVRALYSAASVSC